MAERRHHTHPHVLAYVRVARYEQGWQCDVCKTEGKQKVWHCDACSYDLCDSCIRPAAAQTALTSAGNFDEAAFRARVQAAVAQARLILDNTRSPSFASDVHHEYEDKFLLAEYVGNTTLSALVQAFEAVGLTEKVFAQLKEWSKKRSVSLRLRAEESCKFLRKVEREEQSDTKIVNNSTLFGKSELYTVTKVQCRMSASSYYLPASIQITEWFWQFDARYELIAFMGNEPEKPVVLASRSGSVELKTTEDRTPRPANAVRSPVADINISWMLGQLDEESRVPRFTIDRAAKGCHTPRRNEDVDRALGFFTQLFSWCRVVYSYFVSELWSVDPYHGVNLGAIKDAGVFIPSVPLFDESAKRDAKRAGGSGVVPVAFVGPFLAEQLRTLGERFAELAKAFPSDQRLVTLPEGRLLVVMLHVQKLCAAFGEGLDSIENMLFRQLVAAIGKEVHALDFANYMRFHSRKLFKRQYVPLPFSYAIRREGHDPEGTLSIEAAPVDGSIAEPIATIVRHAAHAPPMKFALDASTEVRFGGQRFLHSYVSYQFGGEAAASLSLRARARQFSSYIVLVGAIASADLFVPKYGVLVQNKDELRVPLNLETIPTPKEFRDAIESLSPEQQRFAKAFRSMQLESTLFGVLVLQVKPQLERLLNLPPDALTKEIALAQDLQTLFIDYQMPSDLLSFDGDARAAPDTKVARVRDLCAAMMSTINKEKDEQLRQERLKQELRRRQEEEERHRRDEDERRASEEVSRHRRDEDETRVVYSEGASPRSKSSGAGGLLAAIGNSLKSISPRAPRSSSSSSAAAPAPAALMMDVASAPSSSASNLKPTTPAGAPVPAPEPSKQVDAPKVPDTKEKARQETERQQELEAAQAEAEDYTKVPQELERKYEALDEDSALRPTIISAGNVWSRRVQKTLLSKPEEHSLGKDEQAKERNRAFDLLDALTKSGAMPIAEADLHVVIAATHCFAKSVMNTVVQDNINPIEKVERSALIVGTTVHRAPAVELVQEEQAARVAQYSPKLIDAAALAALPQLASGALQPVAK